ncbi:hypothetical protein RL72_00611 [Microbacterium azadirachtae]|uniref:Uncharacterized protein n=1 Tax=Microbacterium azadirachtae TaxID=582680 RepID=A0A0F0L3I6_9MICO|nr:hypothetical protein RL72_00611 [Microbacterium azadirachtae]
MGGVGRLRGEPGAAEHRLGGAHGDRQGLRDQRAETAAAPDGGEQPRDHAEHDHGRHPAGGEVGEALRHVDVGAVGVVEGRHVPDHVRPRAEQGEAEGCIPAFGESIVREQGGAVDDRPTPAVVLRDQHRGTVRVAEARGDAGARSEELPGRDRADMRERRHVAPGAHRRRGRRERVVAEVEQAQHPPARRHQHHIARGVGQLGDGGIREREGVAHHEGGLAVELARGLGAAAHHVDGHPLLPQDLGERLHAARPRSLRIQTVALCRGRRGEQQSCRGDGEEEDDHEDPAQGAAQPAGDPHERAGRRGVRVRMLRDARRGRGRCRGHAGTASIGTGRWERSRSSVCTSAWYRSAEPGWPR